MTDSYYPWISVDQFTKALSEDEQANQMRFWLDANPQLNFFSDLPVGQRYSAVDTPFPNMFAVWGLETHPARQYGRVARMVDELVKSKPITAEEARRLLFG